NPLARIAPIALIASSAESILLHGSPQPPQHRHLRSSQSDKKSTTGGVGDSSCTAGNLSSSSSSCFSRATNPSTMLNHCGGTSASGAGRDERFEGPCNIFTSSSQEAIAALKDIRKHRTGIGTGVPSLRNGLE
ncbi:hypothetical protein CSUI_011535, partial [Cystoisospora suis]